MIHTRWSCACTHTQPLAPNTLATQAAPAHLGLTSCCLRKHSTIDRAHRLQTTAMQQQHDARASSHQLASTSYEAKPSRPQHPVPTTLQEAVATFAAHPTTIVILLGIASVLGMRSWTGAAWTGWDVLTAACVAGFWVVQEWAIHKYLLHAPFEWFGSKVHVDHHQQPYHHVSIDPLGIVLPFMMASGGVLYGLLHDAPSLALTATATYYAMGLTYEWVHFLVHTRYVPRYDVV